MATITHEFVSAKSDGGDATLVRPSDWNADHVVVGDVPYGFIGVKAYNTGTVTPTADNTFRTLALNAEEFDSDTFHDNSTNNTRLTVPAGMGGKYRFSYSFTQASSSDGQYIAGAARKNGSTMLTGSRQDVPHDNNGVKATGWTTDIELAAGDYIEIGYLTNASGNIGSATPELAITASLVKLDAGRVGSGVGAVATNSANQNLTAGATVYLTFDGEDYDTDLFHSTSSNTGRLTVPAGMGGKYRVSFYSELTDSTGGGWTTLRKNGSTVVGLGPVTQSGGADWAVASADIDLAAGDYVEVGVRVVNASKQSLATDLGVPRFSIMRLDSQGAGATVFDKATVNTQENTSSTSYADLATAGPAVTVVVSASGAVRLSFSAEAENDGVNRTYIGFAISGATTTAAADATGAVMRNSGGDPITIGRSLILEGLAAGSTTFTMKYRVTAGNGTYLNREINVEAL